jgi:hypothetical protein
VSSSGDRESFLYKLFATQSHQVVKAAVRPLIFSFLVAT